MRIDVALSIAPVFADDGSVMGASTIARDITDRTRVDRERGELLQAERTARAQAEGARERLAFLAEASTVLSGSLDYNATLHRLADLAVSRLADWCLIEMVDEDRRLSAVAVSHRDSTQIPRVRALTERIPFHPDRALGPANVVRTGRPELYAEVTDELLGQVLQDPAEAEALREMGVRSGMIVPLSARGRIIGAMTFASTSADRRYGPEDLALAEELARHAALAIDNAKLYRDAEHMATQLEHRVAERTAELEASNRELEAFSYSVSHDLRAPLRAIDGFSRILLKDFGTDVPDQAREYLEIVREGAQQMGRLIDDLLAFARLGRQSLSKETVDPATIVHRVLEQLRHDLEGRDVEVRVGHLPACQGDPALLHQVYVNLLANALKFTRNRSPAIIEVRATEQNGRTVYFVKDNGVGFDMRFADKLFGVFQRMHRAEDYEGTGVGLAIVQRVIHRHGGQVWAEAEPDAGATFFFTLGGSAEEESADDG
jgi:signal transduction histidine kinase